MGRFARAVAVVGLGLAASSCGQSDQSSVATPESPALPAVEEPDVVPTPSVTTPVVEQPVAEQPAVERSEVAPEQVVDDFYNVYWGWSIPTTTGTPERLAAGGRTGANSLIPTVAVEELLAGPNDLETEIGMGTSIPAGSSLLGLGVADGTATVDLSAEYNTSSGSLDEIMRFAQLVFTLTQFDGIDDVSFRIDGVDVDEIGSHGFEVSSPIDRDDFADVRPFILVEWPFPGAEVQPGDRVQGESNTFEATVEYVVTDRDGLIIEEGFTTATNGNGTWGTFEFEVALETEPTGLGAVIVFESSAMDGSQVNLVEYPITFGGDGGELPRSS